MHPKISEMKEESTTTTSHPVACRDTSPDKASPTDDLTPSRIMGWEGRAWVHPDSMLCTLGHREQLALIPPLTNLSRTNFELAKKLAGKDGWGGF